MWLSVSSTMRMRPRVISSRREHALRLPRLAGIEFGEEDARAKGRFGGGLRAAGEEEVDCAEELLHVDRFRQVLEKARLDASLDVARHGVRAERDDRDVARIGVAAEQTERLEAVDPREVDVEDDEIGVACAGELDSPLGALRREDLDVRAPLEDARHEGSICGVVFDVEEGDFIRASARDDEGRVGSFPSIAGFSPSAVSKKKRLPCPGTLSTPTEPPISSMRRFVIASPIPAPSTSPRARMARERSEEQRLLFLGELRPPCRGR